MWYGEDLTTSIEYCCKSPRPASTQKHHSRRSSLPGSPPRPAYGLPETTTIKGTHSLHCVEAEGYGKITGRKQTCVCTGCESGCECLLQDYVGLWNSYSVLNEVPR